MIFPPSKIKPKTRQREREPDPRIHGQRANRALPRYGVVEILEMGRRGRARGHESDVLEAQGCDYSRRRIAWWVRAAAFEGVGVGIEFPPFAVGALGVCCVWARGVVFDVAGEFEVEELFEVGVEAVHMQS